MYSHGHMLTDDFQFMKQKCYFLRGVAEFRHAFTPLSSYSIITILQGFQKGYTYYFVLSQRAQKIPAKVQMKSPIY